MRIFTTPLTRKFLNWCRTCKKVNTQKSCANVSLKNIFSFGGAFIAVLAGSGFATGQEILQFFTAFGYKGVFGICISFVLFFYAGMEFISVGYSRQFHKSSEVYYYYGGKIAGTFYDSFSVILIYLCFVVMVSGGGATLAQQYDLPLSLGTFGMAFFACATVVAGLDKIVAILGKTGPFIAGTFIILGAVSLWRNFHGLTSANALVLDMNLMRASSHWLLSAVLYVGFAVFWLAGFVTMLGKKVGNMLEARLSVLVGAVGFSLAMLILCLSFMANIQSVGYSMVPSLILAQKIHSGLAAFFSLIILMGIYGAAVSLLWYVSSRFSSGETGCSKLITIGLTVVALFIAWNSPFNRLINIIYASSGYVGFFLVLLMLNKRLADFRGF